MMEYVSLEQQAYMNNSLVKDQIKSDWSQAEGRQTRVEWIKLTCGR